MTTTAEMSISAQQAGDDLAELSLLNRLIELGGKAAGAHATSNSDDGHRGIAAYVQWQELRAEMCELIRRFYAAAPQPSPTAQAEESVPAVGREQERIAFKDAHRHLELDEVPDAWGRPKFKHSHVEASWLGWIARAARAPEESVGRDAERYRWLREGNDAKHGAAWHIAVNLYGCEWDVAGDAAIASNGR